MAKIADILTLEGDRVEPEKWNVIHLFKTGGFYSAYEWSAWLTSVIAYNDEVRKQQKDRNPLAVTRYELKDSGETFCRIGFPMKSVEKFIPNRNDFEAEDDKHLIITIELPTPKDGTEITYERLGDAFTKWKESFEIKAKKEQKNEESKAHPVPVTTQSNGIISQILAYPLDQRTALDNIQFISSLKQQISSIL